MGAIRLTTADIATFSIGGNSVLSDYRNLSFTVNNATEDVKPGSKAEESHQIIKRDASLSVTLMDTATAPNRNSHLDLSAISIGGNSMLTQLQNGTLRVTNSTQEAGGASEEWRWPQVVSQSIEFDGTILVASPGTQPMEDASEAIADAYVDLSSTIDGATTTVAMVITSCTLNASNGAIQEYSVQLRSKAPDSGAWPASPTTHTTLYSDAMNDPNTALAIALTQGTGANNQWTFNAIITSMEEVIQDGAILNYNYEFASRGAVTRTTGS